MKILIIETGKQSLQTARMIFKEHFVISAGVKHAEKLLERSSFDLVIVRSALRKEEDGHELAKKMQLSDPFQKILVLADKKLEEAPSIHYFDQGRWDQTTVIDAINAIFSK